MYSSVLFLCVIPVFFSMSSLSDLRYEGYIGNIKTIKTMIYKGPEDIESIKPNNILIISVRDDGNFNKKEYYDSGSKIWENVSEYNKNNIKVGEFWIKSNGVVRYNFKLKLDSENRKKEELFFDENGLIKSKIEYEYTENSKLKSRKVYNKSEELLNRIVYNYYSNGMEEEIFYKSNGQIFSKTVTKYSDDKIFEVRETNSDGVLIKHQKYSYKKNYIEREDLFFNDDKSENCRFKTISLFDAQENLIENIWSEFDGKQFITNEKRVMKYDSNNRLTESKVFDKRDSVIEFDIYKYDKIGNVVFKKNWKKSNGFETAVTEYEYYINTADSK